MNNIPEVVKVETVYFYRLLRISSNLTEYSEGSGYTAVRGDKQAALEAAIKGLQEDANKRGCASSYNYYEIYEAKDLIVGTHLKKVN